MQIFQQVLPLLMGNHDNPMGIAHGPAGVLLRATRGPGEHFSHQELEPGWRHAMVRFVHARIRVQAGVDHDVVDQVVDDGRDVIDDAQPIVERRYGCVWYYTEIPFYTVISAPTTTH